MDEITTTLQRPRAAGGLRAGSGLEADPSITDVLNLRPKPANMSQQISSFQEQRMSVGFDGQLRITARLLKSVVSDFYRAVDYEAHAKALEAARFGSKITKPTHLAAFLGQVCVESANFSALVEGGKYSFDTLLGFINADSNPNLRALKNQNIDPLGIRTMKNKAGIDVPLNDRPKQKAAELSKMDRKAQYDFLYAGTPVGKKKLPFLGNGNELSGDGFNYRGRGHLQITGKENYKKYGDAVSMDLIASPELLENVVTSALVSIKYWDSKNLSEKAESWDLLAITKTINGGTNHHEERVKASNKALSLLDPNKQSSDQDWFIRAK
jgi:predicted chitinase